MDVSHPTLVLEAPPAAPPDPAPPFQQCDECGAPVDSDQRYCVACGAHRRHVNDPAARYLGEATARARNARARAGDTARGARNRRSHGLGGALVLALIPVVAAIGVTVGRSSANDGALIRALARHQVALSTGAAPAGSTGSTAGGSAVASRGSAKHRADQRKPATARSGAKQSASSGNSTSQYGSVTQITGAKPTQAQVQQGAQATQQVQKSTGSNYVHGQTNLPGTVVVP